MNDLPKRLDIKAGMMEMGEKIAWGSDTSLMREAAAKIRALQATNDRLRGELERCHKQMMMEWQPIETAPRDKRVLVWSGQEIYAAHWSRHITTYDEAWIIAQWGEDGEQVLVKPTHWMPLQAGAQLRGDSDGDSP